MRHQEPDYPAFFDVDRTVLEVNSGNEMVRASLPEGLIGIQQLLEALLITLLFRLRGKGHQPSGLLVPGTEGEDAP